MKRATDGPMGGMQSCWTITHRRRLITTIKDTSDLRVWWTFSPFLKVAVQPFVFIWVLESLILKLSSSRCFSCVGALSATVRIV